MASEEVKGGFCHFVTCIITDQLAIGLGALERELLPFEDAKLHDGSVKLLRWRVFNNLMHLWRLLPRLL
jgi:hypothetical protein